MAKSSPGSGRSKRLKSTQPPTDPFLTPTGPASSDRLDAPDSQPTDLMPLPEGALDDLPPPPSTASSSWLGREPLARDESDVIRGLTQEPPPPGSSNIFDTGPGGSSRFTTPRDGTEHITGEQPRPSNDVLYADLMPQSGGSSIRYTGDDLFDRPAGLLPRGDSEPSRPRSGDSGPNFNATATGDEGSDLFADPTTADLSLDGEDGAVPLGASPSSGNLGRGGPGSSIFSGSPAVPGSQLDVDHIPIMASADEGRYEDLPFDAAPPSERAAVPRAEGAGAVGFDLPAVGGSDAAERPGEVAWDDPGEAPAAGGSQKSRRMTPGEGAALGLAAGGPAAAVTTMRKRAAQVTGRAPVPDHEGRRRGGWLAPGAVGLLAGAGATAAVAYLGGFLASDPPPARPPVAAVSPAGDPAALTALTGQLDAARQEAADERKRAETELAAATKRANALKVELDKARLPDPAVMAAQRQLADVTAAAEQAKREAATATGKLEGVTQARAAAERQAKTAEAALNTVVAELKANKLAADGDDPAAALAKLPAALKTAATAAASADAQKAAAALTEANARADAEAAKAAEARKAVETAAAAEKKARDELAAAQGKADERVRATETALRQELARTQQAAEQARARQDEEHRRQLADARGGVVVPLTTAETRSRDAAAYDLGRGMTAFFAGQYADARDTLDTAVNRYDADARAWYFLGLSRWRLGDPAGADEALRKGADLERKSRTSRRSVADALLRVQGPDRQVLANYRP